MPVCRDPRENSFRLELVVHIVFLHIFKNLGCHIKQSNPAYIYFYKDL
jgi:hypothetical protein